MEKVWWRVWVEESGVEGVGRREWGKLVGVDWREYGGGSGLERVG